MSDIHDQAIVAALKHDWDSAITLNKQILEDLPDHLDTLNRLAYAYTKKDNLTKSLAYYKKVLEIDQYNPIALKNVAKLKQVKPTSGKKITSKSKPDNDCTPISPGLFLTDGQKTKTVQLVNPAPNSELQKLCLGQILKPFKRRFELQVKTIANTYVGTFPDDIGHTLMKIIAANKKCDIYIKDIVGNSLTVFVKHE